LEAAVTKWNFLPFKLAFIGGHCIGVDPYYRLKKAVNWGTEIILAADRL
jgi:UDP-N-acetyl-D-galactosamine dehydrogenase